MSPQKLGRTLIIADPTAHGGKGEGAALFATRFFSSFGTVSSSCEIRLIENPDDARHMASGAHGYQTVIALGGDMTIHEVVNGMMHLDEDDRPRLGIIPMGSANDFARTIGITRNDPSRAISDLMGGEERLLDLGVVNGNYFVKTLSFGVDAAIAIESNERLALHESKPGPHLFVTTGLRRIVSGLREWPFRAIADGDSLEGVDVAFAIQNGPTYGGGFKVCPEARPNDGLLDLCVSITKPSVAESIALFGLIRAGKHTNSPGILMRKIRNLKVQFLGEEQPPCQMDGKSFFANDYDIRVVPRAISVIVSQACAW